MRILVTGAAGFVGTYLLASLATRWPDATVTGICARGDPRFVEVDLLEAKALDAAVATASPDVVVHLAGQASVGRSIVDAGKTWAANLTGSLNLALSVARHRPKAIVLFASSSEVYGASFLSGPVSETSPLLPMNDYARSKALAERVFADVLTADNRLIVARPFNHTGPGQREDFVLPSFAAQVARIEAGLQEPRLSVGNLKVRRDFLDVRDIVAAYCGLIAAATNLPPRLTCNIASGTTLALDDLVETLRSLASVPFEIVPDADRMRPADIPIACADAHLITVLIGWRPEIPIERTLHDLLASARAGTRADRLADDAGDGS